MPKSTQRCPHADCLDSPVNYFITEDGTPVELCADCTADLCAHMIDGMSLVEFQCTFKQAKEEERTC